MDRVDDSVITRLLLAERTRRALTRLLAILPLAVTDGLLIGNTEARRKRRSRDKVKVDRKKKKKTLCLNGLTIQASKKKRKKLLKRGATEGACATIPPTPCKLAWSNATTFGSEGTGENQFSLPFGVALSGDGLTAWVADSNKYRVSMWTRPNGNSAAWSRQTTFGSLGTGATQLNFPEDVVLSSDERTIWIADTGNNRVSVWTRPSTSSTNWSNQTTFGSVGVHSLAVSGDELTFVTAETYSDRISVWSRISASSTTWSLTATFGSQGAGPEEFNDPHGVAISQDGLTVVVADTGSKRISIWTRPNASSTAWTHLTTFGTPGAGPDQLESPGGIALSGDALTAWVVDSGNHRISVWLRDVNSNTNWKNSGTFGSQGAGVNQFYFPNRIAVADDAVTVAVTDTTNGRISVGSLTRCAA